MTDSISFPQEKGNESVVLRISPPSAVGLVYSAAALSAHSLGTQVKKVAKSLTLFLLLNDSKGYKKNS